MLGAGQRVIQRVRLRHDTEMRRRPLKVVEDRVAAHERVAGGRKRGTHHDINSRRLARAVRAKQSENFAQLHAHR
mgnify:CR=1 FL=1